MPSTSYKEFSKNLTDVKRIVALHVRESRPTGAGARGKRALGHLTRGGIVLLCAAWERYVESVLAESAAFLARRHTLASLPAKPKKMVVDFVNGGRSSFTAATLAANLEDAIVEAVEAKAGGLHTPKHRNLKPLFDTVVSLPDIASAWTSGSTPIDGFVSRRGEVAHRGGQAKYVHFAELMKGVSLVSGYTIETDNFLSDHLRLMVSPHRRPWNRQ